ncbi:Acyl-CoA N-acyltransferase with RING/FYVE/PHD-type zinc finger protein [Rhynchospora pubera]|uniref:Acyl-CoA N-acyltransferase with RING/FYVE/PHD-type zinc finger protein n=1 Tax=Rhynchospora pubera TaxID=906938 RepID=A0AAV8EFM5_9POAL|nr:Acyl-CoA N-acyltransferase with RING/FYVE/PHD-type zinc finger protein [Rhynchospora pubera]
MASDQASSDLEEPYVLRSGVRAGLKREFTFAMRAQSEISSLLGRTRSSQSAKKPKVSELPPSSRPQSLDRVSVPSSPVEVNVPSSIHSLDSPGMKSGAEIENKENLAEFGVEMEPPVGVAPLAPSQNGEDHACAATGVTTDCRDEAAGEAVAGPQNETPVYIYTRRRSLKTALEKRIEAASMEAVSKPVEEQLQLESPVSSDNPVSSFIRSAIKQDSEETGAEVAASDIVHADMAQQEQKPNRRFTRSVLKDRAEGSQTGAAAGEASASGAPSRKSNLEIKMSKKISVNKVPGTVRDLLSTGLLEGLAVEYKFPSGRLPVLHGIIKGIKILCSCTYCGGRKALSPLDFELHAKSMKKHPSKYIYLANGNNLQAVMKACTEVPLDMLESVIQEAVGMASQKNAATCTNCKEPFLTYRSGKFPLLCDSCSELHQSESTPRRLEATSSERTAKSPDSALPPTKTSSAKKEINSGQLTLKDIGLHKLVFESKKVPEGTLVCYRVHVKGKKGKMVTLLKGHIKGSGIYCDCCSKVISPSQFEAHAGRPATRKPYNNTYIHTETDQGSTYTSLHELAVMLSKDPALTPRRSDDLCRTCGDGGTLVVCDICPRAFHPECVGLKDIPEGQFFCRLCKPSKRVDGNNGQVEQIVKQCTRIAIAPETSVGGCVLCKVPGFCATEFNDETMLLCDQCDKEYHIGCLRKNNIADFKKLPDEDWFCTGDCKRIHEAIRKAVLAGAMQPEPSDLDVVRRKRSEKGLDTEAEPDLRWRLLSSNWTGEDCKFLFGKSVDILHDSFSPIQDATMKQDLIPQMIMGGKWKTWDYHGMCCAILTEGSLVVSVALLRVMGENVAELPLVATWTDAQGLGYFPCLFNCIERLLMNLEVKHFLIPSAEETEALWTSKFGFSKITTQQLTEVLNGTRMTVFQGTSVLHKLIPLRERN